MKAVFGFVLGLGMAYWMIALGVILCMTGIGAIFGLPLILAGVVMPFAASFMASRRVASDALTGPCPHCQLMVRSSALRFYCPGCKQMVIVKNRMFGR